MPIPKKDVAAPSPFVKQMSEQVTNPPPANTFDPFKRVETEALVDAAPAELPPVDLTDPPADAPAPHAPEELVSSETPYAPAAPPPAAAAPASSPERIATLASQLHAVLEAQRQPQPSEVEMIMSLLSPSDVSTLEEIAARQNAPMEAIIAGLISQLGQQGNLGDFSLNPDWPNMLATGRIYPSAPSLVSNANRRQRYAPLQCEGCGHTFTPTVTHTQRYCCNECGKIGAGYQNDSGRTHSTGCSTVAGRAIDQAFSQAEAAQLASRGKAA